MSSESARRRRAARSRLASARRDRDSDPDRRGRRRHRRRRPRGRRRRPMRDRRSDDRRRRRRRRRRDRYLRVVPGRSTTSEAAARKPPRRRPGGPDDGGPGRAARTGRRLGLCALVIVVIAVFLLFSVGIDLWTDALWFRSVGFDAVFWTRVIATLGLGVAAFLVAARRPARQHLAGRTACPATVRRGRPGRSARSWTASTRPPRPPRRGAIRNRRQAGMAAAATTGSGTAQADRLRGRRHARPDADRRLGPRWHRAVHRPRSSAAPCRGPGRRSFSIEPRAVLADARSPTRSSTATSASSCSSCRSCASSRACSTASSWRRCSSILARYIVGASRSGLVFSTPIRVHLAVLGGLFLLSVAFGYQLDKLELVYSTPRHRDRRQLHRPERPVRRVRRPDRRVRDRRRAARRGAFTRMIWPLGLTIAVWFVASLVIGRLYPEAVQRFTVEPNRYAQEERYIGNNIAMTRLAYDLDGVGQHPVPRGTSPDAGADHRRSRHVRQRPAVGLPRPLRTTLDQLQTVRRYYDFTGVDTDRYEINGVPRQVMLSARELALEQNPNASGWVNQRIRFTHGVGAAMVPVNEVGSEGQPRLFISNLPPSSVAGAPTIDPAARDLLRRAAELVRRRRRPAGRVRLPDRRGRQRRLDRDRDALDRDDRDRARQHAHAPAVRGSASATSTC